MNIPDDPIISSIERTGYPWWITAEEDDTDDEEGADDEWDD